MVRLAGNNDIDTAKNNIDEVKNAISRRTPPGTSTYAVKYVQRMASETDGTN